MTGEAPDGIPELFQPRLGVPAQVERAAEVDPGARAGLMDAVERRGVGGALEEIESGGHRLAKHGVVGGGWSGAGGVGRWWRGIIEGFMMGVGTGRSIDRLTGGWERERTAQAYRARAPFSIVITGDHCSGGQCGEGGHGTDA